MKTLVIDWGFLRPYCKVKEIDVFFKFLCETNLREVLLSLNSTVSINY